MNKQDKITLEEKLTDVRIEKFALMEYPINKQKDIDGDWVDLNLKRRNAFEHGLRFAVIIDKA